MRTILFFALSCFVSSIGALANLGNHQHPLLPFFILYGAWLPFILYYRSRHRHITAGRRRVWMHEQCMRTYLSKNATRW